MGATTAAVEVENDGTPNALVVRGIVSRDLEDQCSLSGIFTRSEMYFSRGRIEVMQGEKLLPTGLTVVEQVEEVEAKQPSKREMFFVKKSDLDRLQEELDHHQPDIMMKRSTALKAVLAEDKWYLSKVVGEVSM